MKTSAILILSVLSLSAFAGTNSYQKANHKIRDILNLQGSVEEVHFTGKNCQLTILSKLEKHEDETRQWTTEDLETSITSNGKTYKFLSAWDAWKSKFSENENEFTVSETLLEPTPEDVFDRGLISKAELEKLKGKKSFTMGSPEGNMAAAIITESMKALTFHVFSEKLDQKMNVHHDGSSIKAVQLKIGNKKISCNDLIQN